MKKGGILIFGIFLLSSISLLFAQVAQEETITITTYYPSPHGIYQEMRSQRMAIGGTYINRTRVCWDPPCPAGSTTPPDGTGLVVEGNVGIGTPTPAGRLDVANLVRFGLDEGRSGPRVITFRRDGGDAINAGKIAYRPDWDTNVLAIVGAGRTGRPAVVRVWDDLHVTRNLRVDGNMDICVRRFFNRNSGIQPCPAGYAIPVAPLQPAETSGNFLCCKFQ